MLRNGSLLLALIFLSACGADPPTTPARDWIELNAITPARGTPLTAGQSVTVTATVTCTIVSTNGGQTVLLFTDQGSRTLNPDAPATRLSSGTMSVTLTDTLTVPPTAGGSTITVVLPLFVDGSNRTRALVTVNYPVN